MGSLESYSSRVVGHTCRYGDNETKPYRRIESRGDGTLDAQVAVEGDPTSAAIVEAAGLDPQYYEVDFSRGIRTSVWDAQRRNPDTGETETVELRAVRAHIIERAIPAEDLSELMERIDTMKPAKKRKKTKETAFIFATGDWQLGKLESPYEDTIQRVVTMMQTAIDEARHVEARDFVIAFTGDCVEGIVSQGGKNIPRTTLGLTEQLRLARRLMMRLVDMAVDAGFPSVLLMCCESNHGDVTRQHRGRFDDNFDIELVTSIADAMELNEDRYGHVQSLVPGVDEWATYTSLYGVRVALQHGHQHRPGKHWAWWDGHAGSRTAIGQADLLIEGHLHHYHVDTRAERTFLGTPSAESHSQWWVRATGIQGRPGSAGVVIRHGRVDRAFEIRP